MLAEDLKALNDSRKEMTERGIKEAAEMIETTSLKEDKVFVIYLPDCHESIAGIIAEPQLWSLACDIAVENVIDSLNRTSVKRPLTYVRQNAYQQITAEETVVAAAPVYRWLTRQTPGVLRQLEREFV